MYYALVQGDSIARQIDPGPSSAMGIKARTKERSTCKHSLATTCYLVPYAIQWCHRVLPCLNSHLFHLPSLLPHALPTLLPLLLYLGISILPLPSTLVPCNASPYPGRLQPSCTLCDPFFEKKVPSSWLPLQISTPRLHQEAVAVI